MSTGPILYRFWDMARYRWKIADFNISTWIWRPRRVWPHWNFVKIFSSRKLESLGYLPYGIVCVIYRYSHLGRTPTCDRRTDRYSDSIYRASKALRGKSGPCDLDNAHLLGCFICHPWAGTCFDQPMYKVEVSVSTRYEGNGMVWGYLGVIQGHWK